VTQYNQLFLLTFTLFVLNFLWRQILRYLSYSYLKKHKGEIPPELSHVFTPKDLEDIENYTLARMRFTVWHSLFSFALSLWWLFGGGFLWLYHWTVGLGLSFIWTGIVLTLLSSLLFEILDIPWDLYESFVLEAKFGFNTMTLATWITDMLKSLLLTLILEFPLLAITLFIVEKLPSSWWIIVWVVFSLFEILIIYIAPYVIEPLFNKYEPLEAEFGDPIRQWAEKNNVKISAVLKMDASRRTKHSNAYFTGIGSVKRIVIFDTMLQNFTIPEILGVLSHELGHWRRHHISKQLFFSSLFSLVAAYIAFFLIQQRWFSLAFGINPELAHSPMGFFSEVLFLGTFLSGISPFFQPISAFFSRRREKEADSYAVKTMGESQSLQSALIKLYKENLSPFHVHPLVVKFTYSHPPLLQRIRFLAEEEKKLHHDNP